MEEQVRLCDAEAFRKTLPPVRPVDVWIVMAVPHYEGATWSIRKPGGTSEAAHLSREAAEGTLTQVRRSDHWREFRLVHITDKEE